MPEITESAEDLKGLLRQAKKKHELQRLNALYLLKSKQAKNRIQVVEALGVDRTSVSSWLAAYEARGLKQLLKRGYAPGCTPLLSVEHQEVLRKVLENPEGFHSYIQIQAYIAETFGVQMNYKAVYAMVHDKWGAKLKVPRKSHVKKTP